jgi:predicted metal-dependent phosphoesterase TrpH
MCSSMSPDALLTRARELGLGGFAVTEHDSTWPEEHFLELSGSASRLGMLIINGAEIRAYDSVTYNCQGDFLVFGVRRPIPQPITARALARFVHGEGGVIIAAHPFRYWLGAGDLVFDLDLDGIEVFNLNHTPEMEARAMEAASRLGIPSTGGSDAHHPSAVGRCHTLFAQDIFTEADFLRELKSGRITPGKLP